VRLSQPARRSAKGRATCPGSILRLGSGERFLGQADIDDCLAAAGHLKDAAFGIRAELIGEDHDHIGVGGLVPNVGRGEAPDGSVGADGGLEVTVSTSPGAPPTTLPWTCSSSATSPGANAPWTHRQPGATASQPQGKPNPPGEGGCRVTYTVTVSATRVPTLATVTPIPTISPMRTWAGPATMPVTARSARWGRAAAGPTGTRAAAGAASPRPVGRALPMLVVCTTRPVPRSAELEGAFRGLRAAAATEPVLRPLCFTTIHASLQ
jgi:hypothetical protein